jgi:glucuronokinase
LSYLSSQVGLSGSSAIVVATFRALLKFYNLTISDFGIAKSGTHVLHPLTLAPLANQTSLSCKSDFPQVILNVEKVELGISAGLQDRVIQTYGGLVHMDFSGAAATCAGVCPYTPLDTALLPEMYLAYDAHAGM